MKKRRICYIPVFAMALCCCLFAGALADHDAFRAALLKNGLQLQSEEASKAYFASHGEQPLTKDKLLETDKKLKFIDLPGGGFLAIYGDVTILDDAGENSAITHSGSAAGLEQFSLAGGSLHEYASSHKQNGKMLIVRRGGDNSIEGLHMGAASYDSASRVVSLAAGAAQENAKILDYLRGCYLPEGCGGTAVITQLNSLTSRTDHGFDVDITLNNGGSAHLVGDFSVTGEVVSADFNPFSPDIELSYSIGVKFESIELETKTDSVNASMNIVEALNIVIVPELLELNISPQLFLSLCAKCEASMTMEISFGGRLGIDSGYHTYYVPTGEEDAKLKSAKLSGEAYAGIWFGGELSFVGGVCSVGLGYRMGYVLTAFMTKGHFDPDDKKQERWHACEDLKCVQGDVRPRKGPCAIELSALGGLISTMLWEIVKAEDGDSIFDFYYSETFGDSSKEGKCPHYGYRLDVQVLSGADDSPVPGVTVTWSDKKNYPVNEHYTEVASKTTGDDGKAVLYVPTGDHPEQEGVEKDFYQVQLQGVKGSAGEEVKTDTLEFTEKGHPDSVTLYTEYDGMEFYTVQFLAGQNGVYDRETPIRSERRFAKKNTPVSVREDDLLPRSIDGNWYLHDQARSKIKSSIP